MGGSRDSGMRSHTHTMSLSLFLLIGRKSSVHSGMGSISHYSIIGRFVVLCVLIPPVIFVVCDPIATYIPMRSSNIM